ncbi:ABC transporter ATP-binding protein [Nocardia caishijiensis]|uniref:Nucleoside ABC transporter ATP-binding protein n=1 Tax=Nocardia caishijiensis TaxID=184756 RepID=A0ABQ6YIA1_9NOCA|nr:ABC transporter ATP-binding protein [Nocardia caishijiensis]KAF0845499.1 nucleoside ABC transporter ATP-binding protein [Nocardia caishijiensis]
MSAPALTLHRVGKSFGAVRALHDVDVTVESGSVHCVLGENGAGKSTLCNLVFGAFQPDTGRIELGGKPFRPDSPSAAMSAGVAMVHQHFSLVTTMTVAENLLLTQHGLRLRRTELIERLDEIATRYRLRVDLDQQVATMPVGARQKVEIVKALLRDPALILLDEPTGVLDPAEIDALIDTCRAIAADGKAVVLVTHKLGEVARVADAATVLRRGTVAGGGPLPATGIAELLTAMVGGKATDLDPTVAATIGVDPSEPTRELNQTVSATKSSGDKAAKNQGGRVAGDPETTRRRGESVATSPPVSVLTVDRVTVRRPDGSVALDGARLTVRSGEIVGVAGVEGNGQSELVAMLGGGTPVHAGTVTLAGTDITAASPATRTSLGLGVVPEDRHRDGMVADMTLAENLFLGRLARFRRFGLLDRQAMRRAAQAELDRFDVRAAGPSVPMGSLSGGNQQKVVLARELSTPHLRCLVAAQPTRGLDIGAVDFVLTRLRRAAADGCGVLVVSSEVPELLALCDRVFVAYRGALTGPVDTAAPAAAQRISELMMGVAG